MTHEKFAALVARLEAEARRNPRGYKRRVVMLAFAGYAYLALVLALLVAFFVAALVSIVWLKALGAKLAVVIGAFVWVVLKALWIRMPPPQGIRITRGEAPALFDMIERLRAKLGSKRFHHVLVTNDFNAGVTQRPRLGPLGWHRNYLLVGLPLLRFLTVPQLESVLAHEFGHLAGGHGRLSHWIYRLRLSFHRLVGVLEMQRSLGTLLITPFFRAYEPYFNGYSFPLARAQEYEADAAAARLVSAKTAAEALTSVNVAGSYLDARYWSEVHKAADEVPHPSFSPFSSMNAGLMAGVERAAIEGWLKDALSRPTTVDDTHPALAERLKALGEAPRVAPPAAGEAADSLLGALLPKIAAAFDEQWKAAIGPSWEQRHRTVQASRAKLAQLDALASKQELAVQDSLLHASLTEEFGAGRERAVELLRGLRERAPDNLQVALELGRRLVAADDEAGVALLERAMALDPASALVACGALRAYCWRAGRPDQAMVWDAKFRQLAEIFEAARKERAMLHSRDKYESHALPKEVLAGLVEQLKKAAPEVRKAYLVRKQVKHFPEQPLFVLAYVVTPSWRTRSKKRVAAAQEKLTKSVAYPGETLVFNAEVENEGFVRKFKSIRDARIL